MKYNLSGSIIRTTAMMTVLSHAPAFAAYSLTAVYPAPGGTTFSSSGTSTGLAGGRTNYYSGFDETAYDQLAWTFTTIPNPWHSSQGSQTGNMTYSGYNPASGIMTWESTANMTWNTINGQESIATKFVAQFQPFTGTHNEGPLGAGWIPRVIAEDLGVESALGGVGLWPLIDVDATGVQDQFQVWVQFQTADGTPLLQYYNATPSEITGSVNSGFSGGFFAAIPETSTVTLGLLGILPLLRRKR